MTLSLTCRRCGTVLNAETEDELAALGQEHGRQHGHPEPMSHDRVLARIRRHNPKQHIDERWSSTRGPPGLRPRASQDVGPCPSLPEPTTLMSKANSARRANRSEATKKRQR